MTVYERFAATDDGQRRLAGARLRYRVLETLHDALARSGKTKADVSRALGIRKSAVGAVFSGDGNLRVNTIADYLYAMGCELQVAIVPTGASREVASRPPVRLELIKGHAQPMATYRDGGRMRPDTLRPVATSGARKFAMVADG